MSEPVPSKVTSQHLTVPSSHPLINKSPSGENSIRLRQDVCANHFATSVYLRESHIERDLSKFPPAMYRPSGLNATEAKKPVLQVTGISFDEPSRKFHIRIDASWDGETRERPLGEKAKTSTKTVNMALIRF